MRDIPQISNEFEFGVSNTTAAEVIAKKEDLSLLHEVNPRDVVELNVSLAKDLDELNKRAAEDISKLVTIVNSMGGIIYGGGSVLADVSDIEPARYRTTSLSNTFARGMLDITSQQIVIGVTDEQLGFELYEYFGHIRPALLALSASSPFSQQGNMLIDTGLQSRRIKQYEQARRHFPESMFNPPRITSLQEYTAALRNASNEVNRMLEEGKLDANWEELRKIRQKGEQTYWYYPFDVLEPHQVFWPERPRPDHRNIEKGGPSQLSVELRVPDMPISVWRVQMLNSFVAGLAYYIADNEVVLPRPFKTNSLQRAAENGLRAQINGLYMPEAIHHIQQYALQGLHGRGYDARKLEESLERTAWVGTDAEIVREQKPKSPEQLREYLAEQLRQQ